jgi:hypothetical protein
LSVPSAGQIYEDSSREVADDFIFRPFFLNIPSEIIVRYPMWLFTTEDEAARLKQPVCDHLTSIQDFLNQRATVADLADSIAAGVAAALARKADYVGHMAIGAASLYASLGRWPEALDLVQRAYPEGSKPGGNTAPWSRTTRRNRRRGLGLSRSVPAKRARRAAA